VEFFAGSKIGEEVRSYVMDESVDIIISSINLAEIYRIALDRFDEPTAEKRRRAMQSRCFLIPVDEEIAVQGARFRHERDMGNGGCSDLCHSPARGSAGPDGRSSLQGSQGYDLSGKMSPAIAH
jgi:hypothetical protein